jgi:hypothetical protein
MLAGDRAVYREKHSVESLSRGAYQAYGSLGVVTDFDGGAFLLGEGRAWQRRLVECVDHSGRGALTQQARSSRVQELLLLRGPRRRLW